MLLHEEPSEPWRRHDFLILEALQIMEQERCGQCGLPVWMCHDESGAVQFSIEEDECVAKRAIDRRHEEDGKKEKKNHGIKVFPSPFYVDDATWIDVRDNYYQAQNERAEQLDDD